MRDTHKGNLVMHALNISLTVRFISPSARQMLSVYLTEITPKSMPEQSMEK